MMNKRFVSIKVKLLSIILPIIIIIISVLTGLSYNASKNVIAVNAQNFLKTSVESQASEIEAWLGQNLAAFQSIKQTIEQMNFDDVRLQDFLDAYYHYDNNYPEGLYVADMEGTLYKASPVKRVELREPDSSGNYIYNGNFARAESLDDADGWILYTALEGEAAAEINENELFINTINEGTVDYSVQFVQPNLPMKKGGVYEVRFDAYADAERTMKISVTAPDRDYKRYLEDTVVELPTEKKSFRFTYTMTDYDDSNGRLEFNLGAAGSTAGVRISNVSVVKTGETTIEEGRGDTEDADVTQSEWFQDGLTRVNMGFTNAYTNTQGQQVISACGMLKSDSDIVRVLSADLSLDKISVYVNSFVKMDDAESFLVNAKDNTILASRETSHLSKNLSELDSAFMNGIADKIERHELDITEIDAKLVVFEEIEGTEWILVSYVPNKTVYRDLDGIRTIMLVFGVISVLILVVLIERIVHIVIRPVKQLTDVIQAMTGGDFTVQNKAKGSDEIGIMGKCVEKFISTMRTMIASIEQVSHTLHTQADGSRDVSGQMFHASKEQNQSVRSLNETVEQLSVSVNGVAQSATTLAELVTETKHDGDGVSSRMKETVEVSQKGKEVMQDVGHAMDSINDSVKQLKEAIDEVGNASEEITNITRVIGQIADETNLLSLNASIEAARAGEAGRGFSVVAMEIGKLAQTSMMSVQNIDKLTVEIKNLITDVIEQANQSMGSITGSSAMIGKAIITYDNIFENIIMVGGLIQNMIEKVNRVEDVARDVAAISEEQAASSQEILGSSDILVKQADDLMKNSEKVDKESKELTSSAKALEEQIKIFKV